MVKRYLVFRMQAYYPDGGWDDFAGSYDDESEAVANAKAPGADYWHVVDTADNPRVIACGKCDQ